MDLAEPSLTPDEHRLFEQAIEEFNGGFFSACHDTLEDVWRGMHGPGRDFFQGLIEVAVALHHLSRGNLAGAHGLFGRGLERLDRYPSSYAGIDLATLREEARVWLSRADEGVVSEPDLADLPKCRRIAAG